MATASTTAWVLHDLGLAANFGGSLFGKLALNPAVKEVRSEEERGKVLDKAWSGFKLVHVLSLATMAGSWLIGRSFLSGRTAGRDVKNLVVAKDILVGAAVITGLASTFAGAMLSREHEEQDVPVIAGAVPSPRAPERVAALQRFVNVIGDVNLGLLAGVLGVTTVLAMKSGESAKWGLVAKLLP